MEIKNTVKQICGESLLNSFIVKQIFTKTLSQQRLKAKT